MTKNIVNLTLPTVVESIEDILDTYPYHPHQQAFSIPDLRQKLIVYVMTHTKGHYAVVDGQEFAVNAIAICNAEERLRIETLIHQGIQRILQEHAAWVDHRIPQTIHPAAAPSSWFG